MDIQTRTPLKDRQHYQTAKGNSNHIDSQFNTPPKNTFQTPTKNTNLIQTPVKQSADHQPNKKTNDPNSLCRPRKENPESKFQMRSYQKSTPRKDKCEEYEVSMFTLTRLEQDYSLVQMLGSGNFSQVSLYRSRLSNDLFAIKQTRANRMSINEVQALGSLWVLSQHCPNVVRYYHSWVEEGSLFLVMEYCEDNLQKIISRHRDNMQAFDESTIKKYLKEALLGLDCLHKLGIVHLDVKPQNLLVTQNVLKIADFGLCRAVRIKQGEVEEGDSRYLAKEVLNCSNSHIDLSRADMFSLAMTIYEMITLEQLPNNGPQWMRIRQQGVRLATCMDLTNYSSALLELVEKMGQSRWEMRPSAACVLQDKYFKNSARLNNIINGNRSSHKREKSL